MQKVFLDQQTVEHSFILMSRVFDSTASYRESGFTWTGRHHRVIVWDKLSDQSLRTIAAVCLSHFDPGPEP